MQIVADREHTLAKEALARGEKDKARTALRRRKYQESLLGKTDSQLETLEGLVSTIEFSQIEQAVLHGLKQGNDVLKDIHKVMNIESVEKLMEETAEAQAAQREIDELLSSQMTAEEEEEVMKELAAIEKEQQALYDHEDGDQDAVPVRADLRFPLNRGLVSLTFSADCYRSPPYQTHPRPSRSSKFRLSKIVPRLRRSSKSRNEKRC